MNVAWFYEQLAVGLGHPRGEQAPVRCFAAPQDHQREDRRPSASVNLVTGAWFCHGCGRGGGAYDAALARGRTPRQAMDLLRAAGHTDIAARRNGHARAVTPSPAVHRQPRTSVPLGITEQDVAGWSRALAAAPAGAMRILAARGLRLEELLKWGVGWDGGRLTLPVRDGAGGLAGLVRYTPWPAGSAPKALAVRGSRRDLFPAPEQMPARRLVLCEGEPDALALLSHGIAAVAIPGVGAWRRAEPSRLTGRQVTIVMDCDPAGRAAACLVLARLQHAGVEARIVDLAPVREDGFDLTDALRSDPQLVWDLVAGADEGGEGRGVEEGRGAWRRPDMPVS